MEKNPSRDPTGVQIHAVKCSPPGIYKLPSRGFTLEEAASLVLHNDEHYMLTSIERKEQALEEEIRILENKQRLLQSQKEAIILCRLCTNAFAFQFAAFLIQRKLASLTSGPAVIHSFSISLSLALPSIAYAPSIGK